MGAATQQLRTCVPRVHTEHGIVLSVSSLRRLGYCWKRCRRSLRAQRDPVAFAAGQAHLHPLHQAEARGEGAVVYVDECRFCRQAPVPYVWQVRGQPPVELPALREAGGYSVLGFWQAKGAGQPLDAWVLPGAFTADLFVLAVNEFITQLTPPTVGVLDYASIPKAHLVREAQTAWAAAGLPLLFLPPYSPELTKIELLWHRCKHYWIRPEDYSSDYRLLESVTHVLQNVGALYTVTFA